MSGTGFLDGFQPKKGNFEPPVKGDKTTKTPPAPKVEKKVVVAEPVVQGSQEPKQEKMLSSGRDRTHG